MLNPEMNIWSLSRNTLLDRSPNTQGKQGVSENTVTIVDSVEHQVTRMTELNPATPPNDTQICRWWCVGAGGEGESG